MPLPPRISIVTPSYNQMQYLEECIDSVLSQGYPNLEYVVMDGGSTDGSVEIIKKYAQYLTYWQSCPDEGQYAAINAGFAHTSGKIMAWLNSDDRYHPNAFLKVSCAFSEHPKVNWLTGRATIFQQNGMLESLEKFTPQFSRRKMLFGHLDKPFIMQEATFWRRELWDRCGGGLDTLYQLAADTELWMRFYRTDILYTLDALLAGFRKQGSNRSVHNIEKYHEEARAAISRELSCLGADAPFEPSPPPLKIPRDKFLDFSVAYDIPRFKPHHHNLREIYLQTVKEWIMGRKGGLESASIFYDEIILWLDSVDYDLQSLKRCLQECLELKQHAEMLIQKGETNFYCNDLDGALQATDEALDIWPTSANGNNNMGVMLYHKGKLDKAIEHLVLVTQHDASRREAYRNLAVIFHELGQRGNVQWAMEYYLSWFPEDTGMDSFYRRLLECP